MGRPVKLSDSLVLDARVAGEVEERSIAGQIALARLGRAVEHHAESITAGPAQVGLRAWTRGRSTRPG